MTHLRRRELLWELCQQTQCWWDAAPRQHWTGRGTLYNTLWTRKTATHCCERKKQTENRHVSCWAQIRLVQAESGCGQRQGRASAALPSWPCRVRWSLLGRVEPQLLDVSQETEESAHLLATHGRRQVGDLDDSSPWYPAHFTAEWIHLIFVKSNHLSIAQFGLNINIYMYSCTMSEPCGFLYYVINGWQRSLSGTTAPYRLGRRTTGCAATCVHKGNT